MEAVPTLENGLWKVLPDGRMETSWRLKPGLVWQDGDQTLPLRDTEDVRRKADYLHHNPVLAGLARHAGDWRWSSYRAWAGGRRTPLTVDLPARDRAPAVAKPCVST